MSKLSSPAEVKSFVTTSLVLVAIAATRTYYRSGRETVDIGSLRYVEVILISILIVLREMFRGRRYGRCLLLLLVPASWHLLLASAINLNLSHNGRAPLLTSLQYERAPSQFGAREFPQTQRSGFILRTRSYGVYHDRITGSEATSLPGAGNPREDRHKLGGLSNSRGGISSTYIAASQRWNTGLYASRGHGENEEMVNYYKVLSLPEDCTEEEIKAKHEEIRESLKSLPSVDKRIKQTIKEAYKVLFNPTSRAMYDQKLKRAQEEVSFTDSSDEVTDEESDDEGEIELFNDSDGEKEELEITIEDSPRQKRGGLSGFLGNLFGLNRDAAVKDNADTRNGDISTTTDVAMKDLVFGGTVTVNLNKFVRCSDCNANKRVQNEYLSHCGKCKGRGMVSKSQRTPFGYISSTRSCMSCNGRGISRLKDCMNCSNTGRVHEMSEIPLEIPSGTRPGSTFKVKGGGHSGGYFKKPGNLFVKVVSNQSDREYIKDDKVYTTVDVDYVDALLGGTVNAETFNGVKQIKIPQSSQHGNEILIDNYDGIKHLVKLNVTLPKAPSKEEVALLKKIAELRK